MPSLLESIDTALTAHDVRLRTSIREVMERHTPPTLGWSSPLAGVEAEYATRAHPIWADIQPKDGRPGFLASEFTQPWLMDVQFLRLLYRIRISVYEAWKVGELPHDVPMRVNSDARSGGGARGSAHFQRPCRAVDLQVHNAYERAVILIAAVRHGIVRLGVYAGEDRSRKRGWPAHARDSAALHLDASVENPSPGVWTRW